jgi:hypothetical protein
MGAAAALNVSASSSIPLLVGPYRCRACPTGALCDGNTLPPRARIGHGVIATRGLPLPLSPADTVTAFATIESPLDSGGQTFHACAGASSRCPGPQCDCLEGTLELGASGFLYNPMNCADGYLHGSPLCALCESQRDFVNSLQQCISCDWSEWVYLIINIVVIIAWFPIMAQVSEMCESLGA